MQFFYGVCCIVLSVATLIAQTDRVPVFEVASVKVNTSGSGNSRTRTTGGQVEWTNVTLKMCLLMAYDVLDYSFSGPDWLSSVRIDIVAKPSGTEHQVQLMMQTLLKERFKLAVHRESKNITGYALVVAAGGPKIHSVEPGEAAENWGRGLLKGKNVSMTRLAEMLSAKLQGPVEDKTVLPGVFNFALTWTPDEVPSGSPPVNAASIPDRRDGPSVFSALQEQLGLKLEARKIPTQVLVVDHMEKAPTEN
jgi:uncharacterized protein (TIGR03435 family)